MITKSDMEKTQRSYLARRKRIACVYKEGDESNEKGGGSRRHERNATVETIGLFVLRNEDTADFLKDYALVARGGVVELALSQPGCDHQLRTTSRDQVTVRTLSGKAYRVR
jgi:hypothetical protein